MELADQVVAAADSWLGQLAVERGWLAPEALELALAEQRRRDEVGRHEPIGAILVARGHIDPPRLGELLVAQQRRRRKAQPAPPRLTRHENAVIGAWLIDAGILNAAEIEDLTRLQRDALRDGDHKQLGELALEQEMIPAGRLSEVMEWMSDPNGLDARFAARPHQAWLLEQFVAAHESSSELGRFQLIVKRSGVPGEEGRVFGLTPDRPMLIGRDVPTGLTIDEPLASPVHAQLAIDESGKLVVTDLGSGQGIYAAGARLSAAHLVSGDAFRIGGTILSFLDREGSNDSSNTTISSILAELDLDAGREIEIGELPARTPADAGGAVQPSPGGSTPPIAGSGTAAQVDRSRALFREFYARESQLRLLGRQEAEDVLGPQAPPPSEPRHRSLSSVMTARGVASTRHLGTPRRTPWKLLAVGALTAASAAGLFALGAVKLAHREPSEAPVAPAAVRALRLPPPPLVAPDAASSALDDRLLDATIHRSRVLRGATHDRFAGFLLVEGRWVVCEVRLDLLRPEVRLRLPLGDGVRVRARGREVPYPGAPVILPDGMRARTRLELDSLDVLDSR